MAVMEEVFATLELFEAIFLSIPHRDLLVSTPLVCRTWYHTMLSSIPIQQRLFLAPAPANTPWIQNPILATKFWPFFHDVRCVNDFAEELRGEFWGSSHYNLSPCMRYLMAGPHGLSTMECFSQVGQEVYFLPEASWRKMLVVQPPVDVLRIYQHGLSEDDADYAGVEWLDPRKEIHLLHGLTMWDVFAEVVQKLDGRRSGGMGIQWNMWDTVESSEEASQHVVVENEPKDSVTLVYVDWWIDRNTQVESPELRWMAEMDITPGQENAKRRRISITLGRPW